MGLRVPPAVDAACGHHLEQGRHVARAQIGRQPQGRPRLAAARTPRSRLRPSPRPGTTCRPDRARYSAPSFPTPYGATSSHRTVPGPARAHRALASRPRGVGRRVPSCSGRPEPRPRSTARRAVGPVRGRLASSHRKRSTSAIASSARAPTARAAAWTTMSAVSMPIPPISNLPSGRPVPPIARPHARRAERSAPAFGAHVATPAPRFPRRRGRSGRPAGRDQAVTATRPRHIP